jgi:hypothetical protein
VKRQFGCWLVLLPLLLLAGACSPAITVLRSPVLDREAATTLLTRAEVALADAFAAADARLLQGLFSDPAIGVFKPELARLRQLGQRIEERAASRRLVHWAAAEGAGEGVLEVVGAQRVVPVNGPPRDWSRIVRQWRAAVHWTGGRWLVYDSADLPPDQWWKP